MDTPAWTHRSFTATGRLALVPPAAGRPVGRGCVNFEGQACTDAGDGRLDPFLANHRETIVVLEAERPDLRAPSTPPEPILVKSDIGRRMGGGRHGEGAERSPHPHANEGAGVPDRLAATEASTGWLGIMVARAKDA